MLSNLPSTHKKASHVPLHGARTPAAASDFSPRHRGVVHTPAVLVVSDDGLLRWALYEALAAAQFRVLTCSDEAHAREVLPKVDVDFAVAIVDDESWPMTRRERDWLHVRWPHLPIVVLAHPGQGLEHRVNELELEAVLLKPFDVTALVEMVERVVKTHAGAAHKREHVKTS